MLDELATERKRLIEQESTTLQEQANRLALEIKELSGQETTPLA